MPCVRPCPRVLADWGQCPRTEGYAAVCDAGIPYQGTVCILAALLPVQLVLLLLRRQTKMAQVVGPMPLMWETNGILGSWLWPGPALAIVAAGGVN